MSRGPQVLLVDDNPGDVRLFREAIGRAGLAYALHVAGDGEEAIAFLHPPQGAARRPDLIILDLNLPRLSGRELLEHLLCCPDHRRSAVAVLTSSAGEREALEDAGLSPAAYFVKPDGFGGLVEVVRAIEEFRRRRELAEGREPPDGPGRP